MIVVKIELWPGGLSGAARTLGEILIHNTGGGRSRGNYEYIISKVGGFKAHTYDAMARCEVKNVLRRGKVEGFPRLRLYATDLLFRVLADAFLQRNTPAGPAAFDAEVTEETLQTDATRSGQPCLDPDKMHGAADQFPGSDY